MLAVFVVGWSAMRMLAVANGNAQDLAGGGLLLAFGAFMLMGALIVAHRPRNTIGWVFSAIGLLAATGGLAQEYAHYAYVTRPGSLPGAIVAAWYAAWWWWPTITLALVFPLLLFPTGRVLSPRWRSAVWLAAGVTVTRTVLAALQPWLPIREVEGVVVSNPIGVAAVENPDQSGAGAALLGLLLVSLVVALVSLVIRFRRSRGDERQQLKWFTYAGALLLVLPLGDFVPAAALSDTFFGLVVACMPVAAGIAILRYRLYDIDRLINRTLVYGLLTGLLGGIYAGVVLILGQLFGGIGAQPPSWAVAGATLAVAALFQPARRRIQQAVDQRFNRRRYDAAKTIEAFSARLRDEIELDTLSVELLAVVNQTMQPTKASLWLRSPTRATQDHSDAVTRRPR
jgi:uncharacterized membrane-anchored protein YitT (DUF2179 family)